MRVSRSEIENNDKRKKNGRMLTFLLAFIMVLSAPIVITAYEIDGDDADKHTAGGIEYEEYANAVIVKGFEDREDARTTLYIPNEIASGGRTYSVISIGEGAFKNCIGLISADISNVTSIGDNAFSGCTNLQSIEMPNVTSIGNNAFNGCSALKSVEIPNVASIGGSTFNNCISLESVEMSKVTSIGGGAFYNCEALKSVVMPNVTSIIDNAFTNCIALKSVEIPNSTSIGNIAFIGCDALKELTLLNGTGDGDVLDNLNSSSGTLGVSNATITKLVIKFDADLKDLYAAEGNILWISPLATGTSGNTLYVDDVEKTGADRAGREYTYSEGKWNSTGSLFEVTVQSNDDTWGYITGGGTYKSGTAVEITAHSNPNYSFEGWSGDAESKSKTISDITATGTYVATFKEIIHTITVNVDGNGGGTTEGTGNYHQGSTITIRAIPDINYEFEEWSDGNTEEERTVFVSGLETYTAKFKKIMHTITVNVDGNGGGATEGSETYQQGSVITIKAIPDENFRFIKWNDGNTDAERTVTVSTSKTYVASFEAIPEGTGDNDDDMLIYIGIGVAVAAIIAVLLYVLVIRKP